MFQILFHQYGCFRIFLELYVFSSEPASAGNLTGKDAKQKGGKKKLRDLNRKGDEKEGTDMDAFLDAEVICQNFFSDLFLYLATCVEYMVIIFSRSNSKNKLNVS